jgi:hypothetical protein
VAENKKLAYFDVWETSILKPWSSLWQLHDESQELLQMSNEIAPT